MTKCLIALAIVASCGARTSGQACDPSWEVREPIAGFATSTSEFGGQVIRTAEWDMDGDGPEAPVLVVVGQIDGVGTERVDGVALWDGVRWSALPGAGEAGAYPRYVLSSVAVYRDELYVSSWFERRSTGSGEYATARWTGSQWELIGRSVAPVSSLAVYNDELIAVGGFPSMNNVPDTANIAAWNGAEWHGLAPISFGGNPPTQAVVFRGSLYVGGPFSRSRSASMDLIARWDGERWNELATGVGPNLSRIVLGTMAVFGERLAVFGAFRVQDDRGISNAAVWDGQVWEPMGSLFASTPLYPPIAAAEYRGVLYFGATFDISQGASRFQNVAEWDGTGWRAAAEAWPIQPLTYVTYRDRLVVSGAYAAGVNIAQFDGNRWAAMGFGLDRPILAAVSLGDRVVVGGSFAQGGNIPANRVAEYDGQSWHAMGAGLDGPVRALCLHEGRVVAGGSFRTSDGRDVNGVAAWNGDEWEPLGGGIIREVSADQVAALCSYGGMLYAGGTFATNRGSPGNNIAVWDGIVWRPVGAGLNSSVMTLIERDGRIIAGGSYGLLRNPLNSVAEWDGSVWHGVGTWATGASTVRALVEYQGELVAGGQFTFQGATPVADLVRLQGDSWTTIGGLNSTRTNTYSLAVYDNILLASGTFSGGTMGANISRWDGTSWRPLGGLIGWPATCMVPLGDDLFLGGYFLGAGPSYCGYVATLNFRGPPVVRTIGSTLSIANACGANQTFDVSAPYTSPLAPREWMHNGRAIADGRQPNGTIVRGASTDSLTIENLHGADAGEYACRVTSPCGSATSEAFQLSLVECCVADMDNGSGRGIRDRGVTIDDLLYYVQLFAAGNGRADLDDGSGNEYPDGAVTIDDMLYYLGRYAGGC